MSSLKCPISDKKEFWKKMGDQSIDNKKKYRYTSLQLNTNKTKLPGCNKNKCFGIQVTYSMGFYGKSSEPFPLYHYFINKVAPKTIRQIS